MNDTYTGAISLSIFGESHGPAVGATLSGLAAGVLVDEAYIAREMDKRRAAGRLSTKRTEPDRVHFLSGVYKGFTTGTAVTLVIENTNTRSEDYEKTQDLLRPGHADWTAHLKYRGFQDARGGGHFSGRLTAPLVAACAILKQMLEKRGVVIGTHLAQCASVEDEPLAFGGEALARQLRALGAVAFPALSSVKAKAMQAAIEAAAAGGDSVGGVLETRRAGPARRAGRAVFRQCGKHAGGPAVQHTGGEGRRVRHGLRHGGHARQRGERRVAHATPGRTVSTTNHNGGVNGGITNGMPLVFRTVVKPTASIYQVQQTVDWAAKRDATLLIHGRHDPCIAHRARAVQDAVTALAVADLCAQHFGKDWQVAQAWNMG